MLRKIYGIGLIIFCVVLSVVFIFRSNFTIQDDSAEATTEQNSQPKMVVEQSARGVYLVDTQNNNTNWELWAESALSNSETSDWRFNNLNVKFYSKQNKIYNVVAKIALVNIKNKEMIFDGGVTITSPNGYVISADDLIYDFDQREIKTQNNIEMSSDDKYVKEPIYFKSKGLKVELEDSIMHLENIISHRVLEKNKKINIESKTAQLYGDSFKVRYKNDVKFKGLGFNLRSFIVDLYVNQKNKLLKTIKAQGRVTIVSGNRSIKAGKAVCDVPNQVITLTKSPKLMQNNDILYGEKVIYFAKTKSVSVKKPRAKVDRTSLESYNEPIKGN